MTNTVTVDGQILEYSEFGPAVRSSYSRTPF